jgi:hypothetical protein
LRRLQIQIYFSNSQARCNDVGGCRTPLSTVIASKAKQSISPRKERMDCFRLRSLSYGGQAVASAPRNVGALISATSSSVMAGLVPAIHFLRYLGMDLFETIAK